MHLNHRPHEIMPGVTKVGDHCSKHFLQVECFLQDRVQRRGGRYNQGKAHLYNGYAFVLVACRVYEFLFFNDI